MSKQESQPDVQFLARFSEAWNRHDIDALMDFMADECEFHAVAGPDLMGRSFVGREAVREGFQLAWQAFPMPPGWMESILSRECAAFRKAPSKAPRPTACVWKLAWSMCSPSATERSPSRTPTARTVHR